MGRPASPDYWRRWRAAHPGYRDAGAGASSGTATGRLPLAEDADAHGSVAEPVQVATHPLLAWAQELAADLVREDRRAHLSDELYPDVVGEILLARLERQDPVARATAWLRTERSWRHHVAPLLEVG